MQAYVVPHMCKKSMFCTYLACESDSLPYRKM